MKVQEDKGETPEHYSKQDISREEWAEIADRIRRSVYREQAGSQPKNRGQIAREIYSFFRKEVLGETEPTRFL